jgi:hypothetical protein
LLKSGVFQRPAHDRAIGNTLTKERVWLFLIGWQIMTRQLSFSGYEHRILPRFREKLNKAESTEDVKKVFLQAVEELLNEILDERVKIEAEDVGLFPDTETCYQIDERLRTDEPLKSYWAESDLPHVIHRLAEAAIGRYKHLEKHPEKTEAKIRM